MNYWIIKHWIVSRWNTRKRRCVCSPWCTKWRNPLKASDACWPISLFTLRQLASPGDAARSKVRCRESECSSNSPRAPLLILANTHTHVDKSPVLSLDGVSARRQLIGYTLSLPESGASAGRCVARVCDTPRVCACEATHIHTHIFSTFIVFD